ncbi:MAG TPA: hypothetical protein VI113_04245 [Alphaproteobacteria bacterium]
MENSRVYRGAIPGAILGVTLFILGNALDSHLPPGWGDLLMGGGVLLGMIVAAIGLIIARSRAKKATNAM